MEELRPTIEPVADMGEGEKISAECGVTMNDKPVAAEEEAALITNVIGDEQVTQATSTGDVANGVEAAETSEEATNPPPPPPTNNGASSVEEAGEAAAQEQQAAADDDIKATLVEEEQVAVPPAAAEVEEKVEEVPVVQETQETSVDGAAAPVPEQASVEMEPNPLPEVVESPEKNEEPVADIQPVTEETASSDPLPVVVDEKPAPPPPVETAMEVEGTPEATVEATTPVEEPSIVDLDTTLETSMDESKAANVLPDTEDDQMKNSVIDLAEDEPVVVESAKEEEKVTAIAETVDVMEVTLEGEEADKTLETPNVSICPLEKPHLLATNNRISELVLSNGSSTPNTSKPTSVEFQATPIKKPTVEEEDKEQVKQEDTEDTGKETDVSSVQEISDKSSSDGGMKRLQETLKQVNGITTTDCSSSGAEGSNQVEDKSSSHFMDITELHPDEQLYDTVVNFQNGMLQCLFVERVVRPVGLPQQLANTEASDASSEKSASNGSTTSLGPFALPGALTHTASGLSVSSTSSVMPVGEKGRVQGVSGVRNFLQELLKKLPEEKKKPVGRGGKASRTSSSNQATTTVTTAAATKTTTPTRTSAAAAASTTSPKAAESSPALVPTAKKQVAFAASTESQVGNFVMARWADRKYYAGRVAAEKPGNKFQVRFEDGASRTLTRDQLVFGDKNVAQVLMNHECNVLVEPNIYETGLVVAIDAEALTYSVLTDSGKVTVAASDLYLDEDQAKAVQQDAQGEEVREATPQATAATTATTTTGRRKRNSDLLKSSPEAGPSGLAEPAAKKSRKR